MVDCILIMEGCSIGQRYLIGTWNGSAGCWASFVMYCLSLKKWISY